MKQFFRSLYINPLIYFVLSAEVVLLVLGFFFPALYIIGKYALALIILLLAADIYMLYANKNGIEGLRRTPERFSNGDENIVKIEVTNRYVFSVTLNVIDELPEQFQSRGLQFRMHLPSAGRDNISYAVTPKKRGEYHYGALNVYASGPLRLFTRRYRFSADKMVPVYPSFIQMRKYELLAISNRLTEAGIKKIRRVGNNSEFDQIKDYVAGDDIRTINWKATARRRKLMTNQYQDERSQAVYSVVDMGRVMRMPFEGLSLLDYAINASLVISNIAMIKSDRAGIITFSNKVQTILPAFRKAGHLSRILEVLYNQKTGYQESDYENLYINLRAKVNQRSLVLLYTNFETLQAMQRQLKYLRRIAKDHLLVVIFFENTELRQLLDKKASRTEDIYNKAIAEKFAYEKRLIVRELEKYGIQSILTAPKNLSVNTINKYLEIKARGLN